MTPHQLDDALDRSLDEVDLPELGNRREGKVRDCYLRQAERILITTDRISAFDRVLGLIPYKGQVLNQLAAWWFDQTSDIVANHLRGVPDPNVTVATEAIPLPVEVVVRGYLTGVTSTSLWTLYQQGVALPYGIDLPPGLTKNARLPRPVITPTTKAEAGAHDERLTPTEVVERGLVDKTLWHEIEHVAVRLFLRGQEIAHRAGLILVDTKYELGLVDGRLTLIDEIHTPDSSRYWALESWHPGSAVEPESFDKEFLRLWLKAQGYTGDGPPPPLPRDLRVEVARRYISTFERLTGSVFEPGEWPALPRIRRNLGLPPGKER